MNAPRALTPFALLLALLAAPAAAAQEAGTDDGADEYVSRELCGACHEQAESFAAGAHGRAMALRDAATGGDLLERSCTACHGDATQHVEEASAETIRRMPNDAACLTCHPAAGGKLALATPAHQRFGVACLDCHDEGHATFDDGVEDSHTEALLNDEPFDLCASCHRSQAAASHRPFAHRDGVDRPFACTECHAVHGTGRTGRLAAFGDGGVCVDCHTEKQGPFVYPHPPRGVDGCVACHQPHGSTNPRMLTRRTVTSLCLECHAEVPAFHDLTQARFRACQSCHFAVHGSNRDPRLFDE